MKLDDPIPYAAARLDRSRSKDDDEKKELESFTSHIAPIVLTLYLIGHYLSNYHTPLLTEGRVDIDPMFGGGILIGTGLYLLKSSIDATFLSPA